MNESKDGTAARYKNIAAARYEFNDGENCVELRWVVDGIVFNVEIRKDLTSAYVFDRNTETLVGMPLTVEHEYLVTGDFLEYAT